MLLVDVRDVQRAPVRTTARLVPGDAVVEGLDITLLGPLEIDGRLQQTADGEYYWQGHLRGEVGGECRRCLQPVRIPVEADVAALFSADAEAADDPSVYELAPHATRIDVGQAVREELVLVTPPFVLCREDCRGLCPQCGVDLNASGCPHVPGANSEVR